MTSIITAPQDRYIVLKVNDLNLALTAEEKYALRALCLKLRNHRLRRGADPELQCMVIEKDWPEYRPTWDLLEDRLVKELEAKRQP